MIKTAIILLIASVTFGACNRACCPNKCKSENSCTPPESKIKSANPLNTNVMNLNDDDQKLLHVCNLTSKEQRERMGKLGKTIFKDIHKINELEDGVELVFNQPVSYSEKLIEYINFERECCPSFTFQLYFEPNKGPIHLKFVVDSQEAKNEIVSGLKEYGYL